MTTLGGMMCALSFVLGMFIGALFAVYKTLQYGLKMYKTEEAKKTHDLAEGLRRIRENAAKAQDIAMKNHSNVTPFGDA